MKIISDTQIRVETDWGSVILLYPNVEKEVGDDVAILAMQQGAKEVRDAKAKPAVIEKVITESVEVAEVTEDSLLTRTTKVCSDLIDEGDPDLFNIDGSPKAKAINDRVGEKVSPEIREVAWSAALNA